MAEELDDFLKHYGVKGMKWGVRKDPDGLTRNERRKIERDAHKKLPKEVKRWVTDADVMFKTKKGRLYAASLKRQIEADIAAQEKNKKQFLAKGGFTEADIKPEKKPGWKPTPAEIVWMSVGAGVLGLFAYGALENHRLSKIKPGQKISAKDYNSKVLNSKMAAWGGGPKTYFTKEAMEREEFTIPAGTTFNRISRKAEDSFRKSTGTYATHSTEDFNRYVNSFRQELGPVKLNHVKFQAKKPIRVSNYKTNARAMAMAMEGRVSSTSPVTLERGADRFRSEAGGQWTRRYLSGDNSTVGDFFEILQHKGYGAVVDEMDAGVLGQTPLVVFATEMFGAKSSSELTPAMIEAAQNALTEIAGRK